MAHPLPDPPALAALLRALRARPEAYLVAIAGIPGSGKSTLSAALQARVAGSIIVPMDGYHLPRCVLDAEGLRRRGAVHTFDATAFREDLRRLKQTRAGVFPAFDHAEKDPRADAIRVTATTPLVIVEGLYVLLSDWQTADLFDLSVFIDCELDTAMERVARRHVACGLCASAEAARERVAGNDRLNALAILADGCRERANLILHT
jgi:pantothenate kinase